MKRVSVRDASKNTRQPVAAHQADVQLAPELALPELGLQYMHDPKGARYLVDSETERDLELVSGVTYQALVNAEGYVLKIWLPSSAPP